MITINNYILEKLHLNKNVNIGATNERQWLSKCENIIFSYIDKRIKTGNSDYDGEYEVVYEDNKLKIIFYNSIRYSDLSQMNADLYKELDPLINTSKKSELNCINNKWQITFHVDNKIFNKKES
jgi:hypothetical protein